MPPAPANILWLASYPKSGNTWLRFLLHSAVLGPPTDSIQVSASIPDIHRPLPTDQSPAFNALLPAKTHFELTPEHPHLDRTDRAVHLLRHPRDVLLSALNYTRLAGVTPAQLSDQDYAERFISHSGDPTFDQQGFGTWASHARSWRDASFPVLTIRYEDLHADPERTLRAVLEFISIEPDNDALTLAIKASSFDNLRALEVREKHDRKKQSLDKRLFVGDQGAARKGALFMNTGKSGQSLEHLAPGLDAALDAAFAQPLAEFGYA